MGVPKVKDRKYGRNLVETQTRSTINLQCDVDCLRREITQGNSSSPEKYFEVLKSEKAAQGIMLLFRMLSKRLTLLSQRVENNDIQTTVEVLSMDIPSF